MPSTGHATKRRPTAKAEGQITQTTDVARGFKEQNFSQGCLNKVEMEGLFWESMWLFISGLDVIRVRVTARSSNDAKKYARRALSSSCCKTCDVRDGPD